jgi:hypothetical protein
MGWIYSVPSVCIPLLDMPMELNLPSFLLPEGRWSRPFIRRMKGGACQSSLMMPRLLALPPSIMRESLPLNHGSKQ